ncbi:hypothetical protein BCS71_21285 [Vibrio lentus]
MRNRHRGEIFVYTLTYLVGSKQIQVLQIQKNPLIIKGFF